MNILKPVEVKSIEQFFQLKQTSLLKVLNKFLKSKYETVYSTEDYIIAIGDIPVALVAHLDTVFTQPPTEVFYDRVKNVMFSPDGLGADDRAGVYSIIQIIKMGLKPTIIFTTEEETGAKGAQALIKAFPNAPTELKYIIELDRRGSNDCVFYECDNPDFEEYIESFGFVTAWGTFSDISIICPKWGIAGVNLSIGYKDEHTYGELLYVGHMLNTIKRVSKMLEQLPKDIEVFKYIPIEYTKYFSKMYSGYHFTYPNDDEEYEWDPSYGVSKEVWDEWHQPVPAVNECYICGMQDFEYNLVPTKGANGETILLCCDCVANDPKIAWCQRCEEAFVITEDSDGKVCKNCEGDKA